MQKNCKSKESIGSVLLLEGVPESSCSREWDGQPEINNLHRGIEVFSGAYLCLITF